MKLNEAIKGYMMEGKIRRHTKGSQYNKQLRLRNFEHWCQEQGYTILEEITSIVLRGYVVFIQEKTLPADTEDEEEKLYRSSTIINHVASLKAFFNWCEQEGLLGEKPNPANRIPKIKADEYLIPTFEPQQLQALLDTCNVQSSIGYRNYTILLVLIDTGIRVSELVGLKLEDVHEDYLTVFGKGSKQRQVGVGPTTVKALWKYIHHYRKVPKDTERHVFVGRSGGLSNNGVWHLVVRLGEKAGIQGVRNSPHTFRHTFAFNWLTNGGDIYKLSRVLGHTDIQTTQIYLKAFQSQQARVDHVLLSPVETLHLKHRQSTKSREVNEG